MLLENSYGSKNIPVVVRVLDRPAVPRGPVQYSEITNDSVIVSWVAPHADGGSPVSGYVVEIRDKDDENKEWKMVSGSSTRTTLKVKRLKTGTQYVFRIRAENRFGVSNSLESPVIQIKYPFKV